MAIWKNFKPKYYKKIRIGKKFRYFYSKEEYLAYLKRPSKKVEDSKNKSLSFLDGFKKAISKATKTGKKFTEKSMKKLSTTSVKSIDKFAGKGKISVEKFIKKNSKALVRKTKNSTEKSKESVEKLFKKSGITVSKNLKETVSKGKKSVEKVLKNNKDTSFGDVKDVAEKGKKIVAALMGGKIGSMIYKAVSKMPDIKKAFMTMEDYKKAAEKNIKEAKPPKSLNDMDKKDRPTSKDEDQEAVNPYYKSKDYAYTNNCAYCTAAYDLRQRGYDVEAMPIDKEQANTAKEIMSWYEDADLETLDEVIERQAKDKAGKGVTHAEAAKIIEEDMKRNGEGARGHLLLYWSQGGGHDVVWEVENNEVVVRDCQTNETMKIYDYLQYCDNVAYFRTDNLDVNKKVLKTVQNRKDKEKKK